MTRLDQTVFERLRKVPRCYDDFLYGVFVDVRGDEAREKKLLAFLNEHPGASTSDVLEFELDNDWIQNDPDVEFEDD